MGHPHPSVLRQTENLEVEKEEGKTTGKDGALKFELTCVCLQRPQMGVRLESKEKIPGKTMQKQLCKNGFQVSDHVLIHVFPRTQGRLLRFATYLLNSWLPNRCKIPMLLSISRKHASQVFQEHLQLQCVVLVFFKFAFASHANES